MSLRFLFAALVLLSPFTLISHAESLGGGITSQYSTVIHFDRIDYFVEDRYGVNTPTTSANQLETAIFFNQGALMEPDADGHLNLPSNFASRVAFTAQSAPNAKLTLGLFSLRKVVDRPAAMSQLIAEIQELIDQYGFTGIDLDWEDMPNSPALAPTKYYETVKKVADAFRPQGIIISTSHAQGPQYEPYATSVANVVDFVNLQFYFAQTNALDLATFRARLKSYVDKGLPAAKIRVGLPSYGMVANGTNTGDKWRSWNNLRNAGVDLVNANQWKDPANGHTYYFSSLTLIEQKIRYLMANGFAGVFTWELTQDTNYSHPLSINRRIDELAFETPTLRWTDATAGGAVGTGRVSFGSGPILNHGVLHLARSGAHTLSQAIDGSGRVEVGDQGTLTLTANHSYTGGTIIHSRARLNLGDGGTTGALAGDVQVGGTLAINRSDDLTLPNSITGTGTFVKAGSGELKLQHPLDENLGVIAIEGGILDSSAVETFKGSLLIGNNRSGEFRQTSGHTRLITHQADWQKGVNVGHLNNGVGRISLEGGLFEMPHAPLILSAGGASEGVLAISQGATANLRGIAMGTSASGRAKILIHGGQLNLGEAGIAHWTPPLATAVREIKLNGGTLGALANWSTSLAVELPSADLESTLATQDVLEPSIPRHLSFHGEIFGEGSLQITGNGLVTLAGANHYQGSTTVTNATLELANSSGSATGTGDLTLTTGARLTGNGTSTSNLISEAGTWLSPGAETFATLTTGATQLAGTLRMDLSDSQQDRLEVLGNLTLLPPSSLEIHVQGPALTQNHYLLARYQGATPEPFGSITGLPENYQIDYAFEHEGETAIALVKQTTAYQRWAESWVLAEPSPTADPDSDGIPNGIEYVIGSNPTTDSSADRMGLPAIHVDQETDEIHIRFRRRIEALGDDPHLQISSTLESVSWMRLTERHPNAIIETSLDATDPRFEWVEVSFEDSASQVFIRLAVTVSSL